MPTKRFISAVSLACGAVLLAACQESAPVEETAAMGIHVTGGTDVERGRYLAIIAGCNDCHTDGFLMTEGNVPEDQWLLGSPMGWRGPWGTTYAKNLRLTVQNMTEDQWVTTLHTRTALPPMPWMNLNKISDADARSLYRYIRSMGPGGEAMPMPVPPEVEPATPYLSLEPVMPKTTQ